MAWMTLHWGLNTLDTGVEHPCNRRCCALFLSQDPAAAALYKLCHQSLSPVFITVHLNHTTFLHCSSTPIYSPATHFLQSPVHSSLYIPPSPNPTQRPTAYMSYDPLARHLADMYQARSAHASSATGSSIAVFTVTFLTV